MSVGGPARNGGVTRPNGPSSELDVSPAAFSWDGGELIPLTDDEATEWTMSAADSWLVDDGAVLALDLHRRRFLDAVAASGHRIDATGFWEAVVARTPSTGTWFPRVESQERRDGPLLVYRHRSAPERLRTSVLVTVDGPDLRSRPSVKGPDLAVMARLRADAATRGADEAAICSPEGFVVEGAYSALLWWRGDTLCAPALDLERVDSVTARSVIALATALGVDVLYESVEPVELDGLEIWVCSALHGIRIATAWIDGPQPAEEPGRLALWRGRLGRLSRQVDTLDR